MDTRRDETSEIRAGLIAAFPAAPITHATIHTADARWDRYDERDDLALLETASWTELTPETLEHHPRLLVYADVSLFRAIVPAYLHYMLQFAEGEYDRGYSTMLPYSVATQLSRTDNREIFDERVSPMTVDQRDLVRRVLASVVGQACVREALRDVLSIALRSW